MTTYYRILKSNEVAREFELPTTISNGVIPGEVVTGVLHTGYTNAPKGALVYEAEVLEILPALLEGGKVIARYKLTKTPKYV
jgi:hypothetical protein